MNLLDTVPSITTTYLFTPDQIKTLISRELDVDTKRVRVDYITDHCDTVVQIQVVIK